MDDPLPQQSSTSAGEAVRQAAAESVGQAASIDRLSSPIRLLVAFSGGPDSLALLLALRQIQTERRPHEPEILVAAAHVDHQLDSDSARRSQRARLLAQHLDVPFEGLKLKPIDARKGGQEAAARDARYRALSRLRERQRAHYLLTGHHADDQIETLLVRLHYGTGLDGLAGIQPRRGQILRPLLQLRRETIEQTLIENHLEPTVDPTNERHDNTRNRVRHLLLPHLEGQEPNLGPVLLNVAQRSLEIRKTLAELFDRILEPRPELAPPDGRVTLSVQREPLVALDPPLFDLALSYLHRLAKAPYPSTAGARRELSRQLRSADRIGIDCGGGWRWRSRGSRLEIEPPRSVG